MTAIFVTATGTDIGKTFVTAGLIRCLRAAGAPADAIKPVVTGYDPSNAAGSDPAVLLDALGQPATPDHIDRISPVRFAAPLSPHMAARQEGGLIDFDALVEFCRRAVVAHTGTLFIEGVGGIMVPLNEQRTVLDWMTALGRPAILVAGSYLGSLSHTLTCLDVLQRRDIPIKALVVNESANSTVRLDETVETLARFAAPIPVAMVPRLAPGGPQHGSFARIASLL